MTIASRLIVEQKVLGEYLVRDLLRDHTNLQFERVPMSGALEYLKGDLYVPNERNHFCIEVKNYADSPLSDKILPDKNKQLVAMVEKAGYTGISRETASLTVFYTTDQKIYACHRNKTRVHKLHLC